MIKKTIHFLICIVFANIVIAQEKTIELKVNDRILGEVVVNIMNERFDLTPR